MVWDWIPTYWPQLVEGFWVTIQLLVLSIILGTALALPIGLVQVTGPRWLSAIALAFCTTIRGTPLLIQLWLLYYGLGSLFPGIPLIRESWLWPILRDGYAYAVVALTMSVAGYQAEIMRAAFLSVPKGELEAGRAYGMSRFTLFRRIWLPRAYNSVLPTIAGEWILTMKSTPLVSTIAVFDLFGQATIVRQETYRIYEPLLFIAVIYIAISAVIAIFFRWYENRTPATHA